MHAVLNVSSLRFCRYIMPHWVLVCLPSGCTSAIPRPTGPPALCLRCHGVWPPTQVPKRRYNLAQLPTPVHRWHLPGLPPDVEVWVKRDDMTGMQLSGNKVRAM
eukprot:353600-Chlamydomonas_euryale.AAC.1